MASIAIATTVGPWVAANAGTIATVASVASAGVAAYETHQAGVQAADQAKAKARVEADRAAQEQINSRQNMLRALASQNAGALGAVGTGAATGFGANARRQITQGQNDLLVSKANASAQISLLDQQASNAVSSGNIEAAGGLVKSGVDIYRNS